jgi:hypothetical protein
MVGGTGCVAKEIHFLRGREDFGEFPGKGAGHGSWFFGIHLESFQKKKSGCATAAATAVAGTLRPHPACFPTTTYEEEDTQA